MRNSNSPWGTRKLKKAWSRFQLKGECGGASLWKIRSTGIVLGAALVLLSSCEKSDPQPQSKNHPGALLDGDSVLPIGKAKASHKKMERTLERLSARLKASNPYYSDVTVRALVAELAQIDRSKSERPYLQKLILLGRANVDYGNLAAGIQQQSEAYRRVTEEGAPKHIRRQLALNLGVANLRLAETENCCALYAPESCILPLKGRAIHTKRAGSEAAIRYFSETMAMADDDDSLRMLARWLLNLAYMTLGDYPENTPSDVRLPEMILESEIGFPKFKNVAEAFRLATDSLAGGAVADDFDNDGDFDLMVSSWEWGTSVRYFENRQSEGFVDQTEFAGLSGIHGGLNMVQADYDNDGDVDVLVLRGAWLALSGAVPNSLLRNEGDGTFLDVSFAAGIAKVDYPTQTAAWMDYDNDGDLDLYVGNEHWGKTPTPNQLFRNEGNGTFSDVAKLAGVTSDDKAMGVTKAVVCGDVNNDGWPDIVVSEYDGPNRLYRNNRDGTFTNIAKEAGIEMPLRSFPAWIWDYDNDGNLDIFISSYTASPEDFARKALKMGYRGEISGCYRGDGEGGFKNLARQQGFEMPMLSMGANFGDLNNDGYPDLYIGTGDPEISSLMPNLLFLNQGGSRFADVSMASGLGHLQKGHAIAFADFDGDGDQDIFEQMGGARRVDAFRDALYENPGFGNHWIGLKLVGTESNRSAIGVRIRVDFSEGGTQRSVFRHVDSGGSFGANPLQQHVGIGSAKQVTSVQIHWPTSGITQTFQDLPIDRVVQITEGRNEFVVVPQTVGQ